MTSIITLNADALHSLDLSPAQQVIEPLLAAGSSATTEPNLQFAIDYPREGSDPRELSEIPEVRLWFVRLDAHYPWLLWWLDWKNGELGRYIAMLVPHQFSPTQGIQFNPEALELVLMHKIFALSHWLQQQGIEGREKLKGMAQVLGYELDDGFFDLLKS
jgi:hypothetical protein